MNIQFRPIEVWPRAFTPDNNRRGGVFKVSYPKTLKLLEKEIENLGADAAIIQTAMQERDIRLDGWPRADARTPPHPGVIVSFEARGGPLSFPCDEFVAWRDNLRGIALTLERLRLVDLYGVTKIGEQYAGWKALPPATATPSDEPFSSREEAIAWLRDASGIPLGGYVPDADEIKRACRVAARKLHPDAKGGDAALFRQLEKAKEMLGI